MEIIHLHQEWQQHKTHIALTGYLQMVVGAMSAFLLSLFYRSVSLEQGNDSKNLRILIPIDMGFYIFSNAIL